MLRCPQAFPTEPGGCQTDGADRTGTRVRHRADRGEAATSPVLAWWPLIRDRLAEVDVPGYVIRAERALLIR